MQRQLKALSSIQQSPAVSTPLTQSVGGAVNNVATRKINCRQAVGLGGASGGQAGQKRPMPVIFQAGQEMRQAGAQLCGGSEEHGGRSNREGSQSPS